MNLFTIFCFSLFFFTFAGVIFIYKSDHLLEQKQEFHSSSKRTDLLL